MGVYIPHDDYSAMQGPCLDGFHIPTKDEWDNIKTIWTALGGGASDGTNFSKYLKLPFEGMRDCNNSNVILSGTIGGYWSSSRYDVNNAYYTSFSSSALNSHNGNSISNGFSIRPLKDYPVIPTSSWTKLYGTSIEAGGIFWSGTDGLISLSSDGNTWMTIADKNLGATQVWNNGDTNYESNCGWFYQRGNNYGFPYTGSVTTSSTQVAASTYGPGNYYSSSTFIITNPRDTSNNNNLRGGVTGVKPMSELKNAYIGEYVLINTPGIYHNATLGLISLSSNGSTRITIADKNLGATTVYNNGDTFSEANSGKFYKYGNNYGFPYSGGITTNSSLVSNLSGYGPGNYYSNSTGYGNNNHRTDVNYPNLWGYVTGTKSAMQGPCPSGYNVGAANTDNSLMAAINILVNLLGVGSASDITEENLGRYLLLPNCGYRAANGAFGSGTGYLNAGWTSGNSNICYVAITGVNFVGVAGVRVLNYQQGNFYTIRPIKNEAVVPDASRTKLY